MSTTTHDIPGEDFARDGGAAAALLSYETSALIDYILTEFHEAHRRDLAGLLPLARQVEEANRTHPQMPKGLAELLAIVADELEDHLQKEEIILFPMIRAGAHHMVGCPIARMRVEHDSHEVRVHELKQLTNDCRPPADADAPWQALYAGIRKLINDLERHIEAENGVLFPRFE